MLKAAVCDDNPTELKALKNLIHRYNVENGMQITAEYYSDRMQIVNLLPHVDDYDCLFLDIYIEELNGIDIARHIRQHGNCSNIIFFTASKEHALDAYGVNALQYLLKPVQYAEFANAIELVMICKNTCAEHILFENSRPVRKKGGGVGVSSIVMSAQRYMGEANFSAKNGIFTCSVLLNDLPE